MRSKTSFFNKTMFLKSVTRFWPVWGSYFVIWLLAMPVALLSGRETFAEHPKAVVNQVYQFAIYGGVILGAIYGLLSAMGVWSFLYNARSAHGLACLPVRREGQFVSNALAGLLPILASNVAIFLLTLLVEAGCGVLHLPSLLTWLGVVSLIYLFFFGFATLCALLTGNIVILPLVYIVLNFVVIGVEELLRGVFAQFVYGMESGFGVTTRFFSPVVGYLSTLQSEAQYVEGANGTWEATGYSFTGWGAVLVYALVGVVMLIGALLLLRHRKMETAGDVVAVKPLKPVFRWCMGLGAGLCFASLMYVILFNYRNVSKDTAFLAMLLFLLVGAAIGWIIAEMLIKKSFRVFDKTARWAGLGACGLVIVAMMLGMKFDLFGYERRVPDVDKVKAVYVYANGQNAFFDSPAGIAAAEQFHRQVIADKDWNESYYNAWQSDREYAYLRLEYELTGGGSLSRRYNLVYDVDPETREPAELHDVAALNALMNSGEAIENRKKLSSVAPTRDNLYHAVVTSTMSAVECAEAGGWASPEEFVLCELQGMTLGAVRTMDDQSRYELLGETVLNQSVNGYMLYEAAMSAAAGTDPDYTAGIVRYGEEYYGPKPTAVPERLYYDSDLAEFIRTLDWNEVYFSYVLELTAAEAWELYESCIVPDVSDGTLGRVWVVIDEEYARTVYNANITIEFREQLTEREPGTVYASPYAPTTSGDYRYEVFSTYPTVDSVRTNAWLTAHGLRLYTDQELDL